MKYRTMPYGYRYVDGAIAVHPQERETILSIFKAYLDGDSLQIIAKRLNENNVEYMPGMSEWNKSRIKRITENERYLGREDYPPIIDSETYEALQKIKAKRNTQKYIDRQSDIFQISVPVRCPICGNVMLRRHDSRLKGCAERWTCQNVGCRKVIAKSDDDLLSEITALINLIIVGTEDIHVLQDSEREQSIEVSRIDNEIRRILDSVDINKDDLRKKILMRVSLKYQDIAPNAYKTKRLRAELSNVAPLSSFSPDIFSRTVKEVRFDEDGTVSIILMNNQQIRKEQSNGIYSDKTAESSSPNSCDD